MADTFSLAEDIQATTDGNGNIVIHAPFNKEKVFTHSHSITISPDTFANLVDFARKVWPLAPLCVLCGRPKVTPYKKGAGPG